MEEVARLQELLERLAAGVPLDAPWAASDATELDRQTFDSWLTANTDDDVARAFFRFITAGLFSAEAHEMSLLRFLFYIHSGGGIDTMVATSGDGQEMRLVSGSQRISEAIAGELGDDVRLQTRVDAIRQNRDGVRVVSDDGHVDAGAAIVALPPTLAGRLRYSPPLPASRDAVTQQVPMGSVIKVQVAYDAPFWHAEGLNGQALDFDDELSLAYDNSPPDASSGVLLGFYEGSHARSVATLTTDERRALTLEIRAGLFGAEARTPVEYVEQDWMPEAFTRGCYGDRVGAGVWT
jgi:monoamine oxidase